MVETWSEFTHTQAGSTLSITTRPLSPRLRPLQTLALLRAQPKWLGHCSYTMASLLMRVRETVQDRGALPSPALPLPAGMNMSPVSRLKKTWAKVKTAKFFILEVNKVAGLRGSASQPLKEEPKCLPVFFQHQMDPTGNFCNYRTALRGAAHRSLTAHSSREKVGEKPQWSNI